MDARSDVRSKQNISKNLFIKIVRLPLHTKRSVFKMSDSREHILATSLSLFLQKNFKEVTMKEIVETTGLSKGAFYHYFKSKEQVFEEVIGHFYTDLLLIDYGKFAQDSLGSFYKDYLETRNSQINAAHMKRGTQNNISASNHFQLIFDAMKMLPDFKEKYKQQQKNELKVWTEVIHHAKKSGGISSTMTDEQIAKLFIYLEDGIRVGFIWSENTDKINDRAQEETKVLWDSLYTELKA